MPDRCLTYPCLHRNDQLSASFREYLDTSHGLHKLYSWASEKHRNLPMNVDVSNNWKSSLSLAALLKWVLSDEHKPPY